MDELRKQYDSVRRCAVREPLSRAGFAGRSSIYSRRTPGGVVHCVDLQRGKGEYDGEIRFAVNWGVTVPGFTVPGFSGAPTRGTASRPVSSASCAMYGRPIDAARGLGLPLDDVQDWFAVSVSEPERNGETQQELRRTLGEIVLPFLDRFQVPDELVRYLLEDHPAPAPYVEPFLDRQRWEHLEALGHALEDRSLIEKARRRLQ